MRKNLILVVHSYPFQTGEPYLEDEIKIHEKEFENIYIIIPETHLLKDISKPNHYTPKNLRKIHYLQIKLSFIQNLASFFLILRKKSLTEINIIKNTYQLPVSFLKIKVLLTFYNKGISFKNKLIKFIESENLKPNETVVYSYWTNEFTVGLALLKSENKNIKCYTRVHGGDLYFHRNTEDYLPWRAFLINNLDGLVSISENGKRYLENKLGKNINSQNILVSKLGTHQETVINQFTISKETNILTLCFLNAVKQIEKLVDALTEIENIKINWTHIGGGNKKYELFIKAYAEKKLSTKSNISFEFIGNTPKNLISEVIHQKNIHLLINTSKYEGIPVSMMEALSMGIPIIGLNVGAVSEIIINDCTGVLLDPNSKANDIANSISKYAKLSDEEFMLERKKARMFWEDKYMATKNYEEFAEMLKA